MTRVKKLASFIILAPAILLSLVQLGASALETHSDGPKASKVNTTQEADTNDFSFESFDARYVLGRDGDGRSTLKTTENLVAVFPNYDQNRGFIRELVRVYDGHDTELQVTSVTDETGNAREFWLEKAGDYLEVWMAVPEGQYVHGRQTYVIEYMQKDVTRYFQNTERDEFYWDVNGTGWAQTFGSVSASVNLSAEVAKDFLGEAACYVGVFGSDESCPIEIDDDGVSLQVANLGAYENVSFAMGFKAGTFAQKPEPFLQRNPFLLLAGLLSGVLALATSIWVRVRANLKTKTGRPIVALFDPPKNLSLGLAAQILKVPTKAMTATLLDLAVSGKIKLIYYAQTNTYGAHFLSATGLQKPESDVVQAVFGSRQPSGSSHTVWFQKSSTKLGDAAQKLKLDSAKAAVTYGFLTSRSKKPLVFIVGLMILSFVLPLLQFIFTNNEAGLAITLALGTNLLIWGGLLIIAIAVAGKVLTPAGSDLYEHLLGLKEYMRLAEAERIRMLQSVTGAEVTEQYVVQIYERLLPYAVLFGQEREWQGELQKYYATSQPAWFGGAGGTFYNSFAVTNFASTVQRSPHTVSTGSGSGSGSSFSSFSGGSSGGGFSGGGGGGGGGRGI